MFPFVETASAATEAAAHVGVAAKLGLDWRLFLGQLVNFLIVFFVLWRFVLRPLAKTLQKRQTIIDQSLANAKLLEDRLAAVELEHQRIVAEAQKEATALLEEARQNAEEKGQEILADAKSRVAKIIEEGKEVLAAEQKKMVVDTRREIIDLVAASTEKILQGVVDEHVDRRWLASQLEKNSRNH